MNKSNRIVYLTSGAGGMFCGSCMHDNALAKAMTRDGWDIRLVPTYTPIRTDEQDVSVDQVFFGGINVFLQQKIPLLRYVPTVLDRFLDSPWLIRRVTSRAMEMDMESLGSLAVSMLKGTRGNQRKEVKRLCRWLASDNPDVLIFTNILIGGCIPEIKSRVGTPVIVTLQGDDVFLDSLNGEHREQCVEQITRIADHVDGFVTHSEFYKDYMSEYFSIPIEKIHVTPLGIDAQDFQQLPEREQPSVGHETIGYLARLAPEKGLHHLVDAFIHLKSAGEYPNVRLKIAGWLGPQNQGYADQQFQKLNDAGLDGDFEYVGSIERGDKLAFLRSLDLFSVPADFLEPKGLYVLEAMAAGLPVVEPEHGAFPELINQSKAGLLVPPRNANALAESLMRLLNNAELRQSLGDAGHRFVMESRNGAEMARSTGAVVQRLVS